MEGPDLGHAVQLDVLGDLEEHRRRQREVEHAVHAQLNSRREY